MEAGYFDRYSNWSTV